MTTSFTESIGRKVVAGDTAEDLGEIQTFVCDQTGSVITEIQVAGRKRKPALVAFASISAFGPDAVVVNSGGDVHAANDDRTEDMVRGKVDFIGARVLATDGQEHGTVTEVHFDETNGQIIALLGEAVGRVEAADITSLGSYAVVVRRHPAG